MSSEENLRILQAKLAALEQNNPQFAGSVVTVQSDKEVKSGNPGIDFLGWVVRIVWWPNDDFKRQEDLRAYTKTEMLKEKGGNKGKYYRFVILPDWSTVRIKAPQTIKWVDEELSFDVRYRTTKVERDALALKPDSIPADILNKKEDFRLSTSQSIEVRVDEPPDVVYLRSLVEVKGMSYSFGKGKKGVGRFCNFNSMTIVDLGAPGADYNGTLFDALHKHYIERPLMLKNLNKLPHTPMDPYALFIAPLCITPAEKLEKAGEFLVVISVDPLHEKGKPLVTKWDGKDKELVKAPVTAVCRVMKDGKLVPDTTVHIRSAIEYDATYFLGPQYPDQMVAIGEWMRHLNMYTLGSYASDSNDKMNINDGHPNNYGVVISTRCIYSDLDRLVMRVGIQISYEDLYLVFQDGSEYQEYKWLESGKMLQGNTLPCIIYLNVVDPESFSKLQKNGYKFFMLMAPDVRKSMLADVASEYLSTPSETFGRMANEKPIKIEVFDALFKKTQPFVAFYAVKEMACPFPPIPASKLKIVVELDDLKRKTVDADEPNKKRGVTTDME